MNETSLSFYANGQLMVQRTHKVKERACTYLQQRFVNVARPDKWSHNTGICPNFKLLGFQISDPIQYPDHLQPNLFFNHWLFRQVWISDPHCCPLCGPNFQGLLSEKKEQKKSFELL